MRLGYASEAEDALSRLWRKQRKLEAKLTKEGSRPKGMRQKTYDRLCAKIDSVEQAKDGLFYLAALAFTRRYGVSPEEETG